MDGVKGDVRQFFSRFFLTDQLGDGDDIFALGYVNSLFAMQLVLWLEKHYALTVTNDDLELKNFSTINGIAGFVQRKQAGVAAIGEAV
jgi:methoxymalonate biosynthesis acyl carrier protein